MTGRSAAGLAGLATLLDTLGSMPTADAVAEAIVAGPASPYAAHAAIVLFRDTDDLHLVGSTGYTDAELAGFDRIPLAADLPICRAVREAEPVVSSASEVVGDYVGLAQESDRWARFRDERRFGSIVSVPVTSRGLTTGACGFTCDEDILWDAADVSVLAAIGRALALWMSRPDVAVDIRLPSPDAPRLSPRQCAILALVAQGRSTDAIAAALGYSASTVKQDLRSAMRMLGAPTRQAAAQQAVRQRACPDMRGAS